MRYRLALDLGTTSIGWAVLRLDATDKPCAIVKLGSRIFSDGRHPQTAVSLAAARRLARQQRRRRDRLLKRKRLMQEALVALGFLPTDEAKRQDLVTHNPYELRAKGLDTELTGPEFGRAMLHINQRRGFKSNRKTDAADNDSGALKQAIKRLNETLEAEQCRTLGEWLAKRYAANKQVRARLSDGNKKDRAYNFYADRGMIEHEFDTLWAAQQPHNPALFTDDARDKIKDILLFQRPLRPQVPGRCTLEPALERAPNALPSVQRMRIYQELNNLRVIAPDLSQTPLTREQRDIVAAALERRKDLTFTTLRNKVLKLPSQTTFSLEGIKRDRLQGNLTSMTLGHKKIMGEAWHALHWHEQDAIVEQLLAQESERDLLHYLQQVANIDSATAQLMASAALVPGFGRLSREAIARILPVLHEQVITYDKAVLAAGYGSHSQLGPGSERKDLLEALPYYGIPLQRHVGFAQPKPRNDEERYGKISNPTVHIGLNQIRVVVNALIKRYGHPSEVHIEVARDLKLSKERRREIEQDQKKRQDRNTALVGEACQVLGEDPELLKGGRRRSLSQKMQLWIELNPDDCADRRCPFSGKQISIEQLLSSEVEIEHILPFSQTLDDSMNNKTVAYREANRRKGNNSPFEAFGDDRYASEGYLYSDILLRARKMRNANKTGRFAANAMEKWRGENGFLARAITDTAYLASVATQYLACVCDHEKVVAIPGRLTAMLRGHYGLNRLLAGSRHKNRDDHRHHAIDAAVIGLTDRGLLQRFAAASESARQQQLDRLIDQRPLLWPSFERQIEHAIAHLWVSHKPDHGYQGAMHEESAWGLRPDGRATLRKRNDTNQRVREYANKKLILITEPGLARHGVTEDGDPKPYKGYVGGSNYCIEIWRDAKGKYHGDVISTFDAYQLVRQHGEAPAWAMLRHPTRTLAGQPLVMRLMRNDTVEMTVDEQRRVFRVVSINAKPQVVFAPLNEANVDARNRDKKNVFAYTSKTPGKLMKAGAQAVVIDPIGRKRLVRHRR